MGCQRGARGGIWRGGGLAPMRRTGGGVGVGALARRTGGANEAHVGGLARGGLALTRRTRGLALMRRTGGGGGGGWRTNEADRGGLAQGGLG